MESMQNDPSPKETTSQVVAEAPLSKVDPAKHKGYLTLMTTFNFGLAGLVASHAARNRFADGIPWGDLTLLGVAAHKLSRLVTTERVTEPLREPFVQAAVNPRSSGLRRALGELVTCPYCSSSWMTLGLSTAYVVAPNATRVAAGMFTVMTISDFLSRLNMLLREKGELARELKREAASATAS